jgi:hypothetical protein
MWHIFRSAFAWHPPPHFHHDFARIHHAKHHVLRTQILKDPCKNATKDAKNHSQKKIRIAKTLSLQNF